jgi:uncharacterized protein
MNVVVFGARGRVGRHLVRQAVCAGHQVTALVRNPAGLGADTPAVRLVVGSVVDPGAISAALKGQDVAFSALGPSESSWPHSPVSVGIQNITRVMETRLVPRLVTVGLASLLPHPSDGPIGDTMAPSQPSSADEDHRRALEVLQQTSLGWIVVCPPAMPDGNATGTYRVSIEALPEGGHNISPADVANFMLANLAEDLFRRHQRHRVGIAY